MNGANVRFSNRDQKKSGSRDHEGNPLTFFCRKFTLKRPDRKVKLMEEITFNYYESVVTIISCSKFERYIWTCGLHAEGLVERERFGVELHQPDVY